MSYLRKSCIAMMAAFFSFGASVSTFAQADPAAQMEIKLETVKSECRALEMDLSQNAAHTLDSETSQLLVSLKTDELIDPDQIRHRLSENQLSDFGAKTDWIELLLTETSYCLDSVLVLDHYNRKYMGARIPVETGLAKNSILR